MFIPRWFCFAIALAILSGTIAACTSATDPSTPSASLNLAGAHSPSIAPPSMLDTVPRDYPGIRNAVAYHDGLISGSVPEADAGFATLQAMGMKTVISVDGAAPPINKAAAHGIRYIHLPIGYNGFNDARKLELTRAARDALATGPVYIHCHHGKHRSAAAAATIAASLAWMSPKQAVERMKISGTAPNYTGLYACVANAAALDPAAINSVAPDFPSIAPPLGLVKAMVELDEITDHLKAIEKSGWKAPSDHPDLIPAAEAGRMADLLRIQTEGSYAKRKPDAFTTLLHENSSNAQTLENLLLAGEKDHVRLSSQFKLIAASCKDCHAKYRD